MDTLSDDARIVLQQLFQHEIDFRHKIDEINGDGDVEVHSLVQNIRTKLCSLKIKIREQTIVEAEDFLLQQYELHSEELENLKQLLRMALSKSSDRKLKNERSALLSAQGSEEKGKRNILGQSSDITQRMQRNTQMLSAMVKQQEETVSNLAHSSGEIQAVDSEYKTLSSVLVSSHRLVTKFGRRAMTDTFLTYLGFFLFICTVLFVIRKRLFPKWGSTENPEET